MKRLIYLVSVVCMAVATMSTATAAQTKDAVLADITFLVGHWDIRGGRVVMFGARPSGKYDISTIAKGNALLLQTRSMAVGVEGQLLGTNESATVIYPDAGSLDAVYINGAESAAYKLTTIVPGKSVAFATLPGRDGIVSQLSYELNADGALVINHSSKRANQDSFGLDFSEVLKKSVQQN